MFSFRLLSRWRRDDQEPDRKLAELKAHLKSTLAGKRALIIGSAPNLALPPSDRYDTVICVNGSGRPAQDSGIVRPELTVIGGHSTRSNQDVRIKTQAAWRGLKTRDLLFVAAGQSAQKGKSIVTRAGLSFETFLSISVDERALIVAEVCREELSRGERDDRISMGCFAAIVALWSGASEAILAGFSLGGGHSYIPGDTPRYHVAGDTRFLRLVGSLPLPVTTNVPEIQTEFDISAA